MELARASATKEEICSRHRWAALKRTLLMMVVSTSLLVSPWAHAEFQNGGFEADYANWNVQHLQNPGTIPTFPPTKIADLGLTPDATNRWNNPGIGYGVVQTDVVGNGSDARVSGALSFPLYGLKSARVNYNGNSNRASSIDQTATMGVGDIDPSDGKVHIRFAVAPVLENPGHNPNEQPYFFIEVRNLTKGTQLFQTFNFSNQSGVPWQTVGGYQYTTWQAIDIGPGPGVLDVGDQVSVTIVASGCGPSGHEGHIYVDSGQGLTTLPGPFVTATGPQYTTTGGTVTYNYHYNNGGTAPMTNSVVTIVSPQDNSGTPKNLRVVPGSVPVGCSLTTSGSIDTVTCPVGTLNPGSTGDLQLTWTVPSPTVGPINHGNYTIQADGSPPLLGPLVQTNITANPLADLQVTIDDGKSSMQWGDTTSYTVTLTNGGPNDAPAGVVITNAVPATLTNVSWTCAATGGATCPAASGTGSIGATTPNVWPSGGELIYTVAAQADPAGTGSSTINYPVSVAFPTGSTTVDPDTSNNTFADVNAIGPSLRTLTVNKDGAGTGTGTVTSVIAGISCNAACLTASADFPTNSSVVLHATAPAGSIFSGWSGGGCSGMAPSCTVTMDQAKTVTATFSLPLNVTATVGAGGSASPGGGTQPVAPGGTASYTVTPDSGYAPVFGGTCPAGTYTGNTYTTGSVVADCTVDITFTNAGVVTATPNSPANGSIIGGPKTVTPGGSGTWTVVPNSGFAPTEPVHTCAPGVGSWNTAHTEYTITPIDVDCTVTFGFAATHSVTGSVSVGSPGPGSILAGASQNVMNGSSAVFTLSRAGATIDLASTTCPAGTFDGAGTTYTVPNITTDCSVVFSFPALPASAASIPTLSEWGLIILSALMGVLTLGALRRRA